MPIKTEIEDTEDTEDEDDEGDEGGEDDKITGKGFIKQVFHVPNNTYTYENSKALFFICLCLFVFVLFINSIILYNFI